MYVNYKQTNLRSVIEQEPPREPLPAGQPYEQRDGGLARRGLLRQPGRHRLASCYHLYKDYTSVFTFIMELGRLYSNKQCTVEPA